MTWDEHVRGGAAMLSGAQVENPMTEARMLWEHVTGRSYAQWLVRPLPITEPVLEEYRNAIGRRTRREPFHYIVGSKEFMGLSFRVNPAVLVPRPETEILVETVLARMVEPPLCVVDVGTGSGAIALSLRQHWRSQKTCIIGVDNSDAALGVAQDNGSRLGLPVTWLLGNLLDPIDQPVDVVVANLPYVSVKDRGFLAQELQFEPQAAIYSGETGTELIGELIDAARGKLTMGGHIFLEVGQGQARWAENRLHQAGLWLGDTVKDYGAIDRVVWARREA